MQQEGILAGEIMGYDNPRYINRLTTPLASANKGFEVDGMKIATHSLNRLNLSTGGTGTRFWISSHSKMKNLIHMFVIDFVQPRLYNEFSVY